MPGDLNALDDVAVVIHEDQIAHAHRVLMALG